MVLDASRAYKEGEFFYVRVKLVDSSLNYFTSLEASEIKQKHIVILVAASNVGDLPNITTLGSILRFENITFNDRKKYVQGTTRNRPERFKVFNPDELEQIGIQLKGKMKSHEQRVWDMFEWSKTFFENYSRRIFAASLFLCL